MKLSRRDTAASVVGAGLLGLSMTRKPGSLSFHALTFGVAGTWVAAAGPIKEGTWTARDVRRPLALAIAAFGAFAAATRLLPAFPPLERGVHRALDYAEAGPAGVVLLTTCTNAVAEEMFFRNRLWSVQQQRPVLTTTLVYTAVTTATRNPSLVVAAAVMGTLFGWQRRATGGIRASSLTHVTWSVLMVRALPRLMRRRRMASMS